MGMMLHRHPGLAAVGKKLAAAKPEEKKAEPVEAEEKPKKARKAKKQ